MNQMPQGQPGVGNAPPGMAPDGSGGFRVDPARAFTALQRNTAQRFAQMEGDIAAKDAAIEQLMEDNQRLRMMVDQLNAKVEELTPKDQPAADQPAPSPPESNVIDIEALAAAERAHMPPPPEYSPPPGPPANSPTPPRPTPVPAQMPEPEPATVTVAPRNGDGPVPSIASGESVPVPAFIQAPPPDQPPAP